MSARGARLLWAMVAAGLAARLVLAFAFYGQPYDQSSFAMVRESLAQSPLDVYAGVGEFRWPYPPAYFLWIVAADAVSDLTGLAFHGLVNVPAMAADVGIAWIVQAHLGRRGADEKKRLAAAGLVLLGPAFIAISGYHGQIDSVAMLPAVAAVALWDAGGPRRGLAAGALLGLGIAIKTVPGLMLLALLPSARSKGEAAALIGAAAAVPLALLAPYLLHDSEAVTRALEYPPRGTAGGIGLISTVAANPVVEALLDHATAWNAAWLAGVALVMWRARPEPTRAAVIVWLAAYVFATGFYLNYFVWGLSFVLLDGGLVAAAAVQAVALAPVVVTYAGLLGSWIAARAFDVPMLVLWLAFCLALAVRVREAFVRPAAGRAPAV